MVAEKARQERRPVLAAGALYWEGKAYMSQGDYLAARQTLRSADSLLHASRELDGTQREVDIHAALLKCNRKTGRPSEAAFERAILRYLEKDAISRADPEALAKARFALAAEIAAEGNFATAETMYYAVVETLAGSKGRRTLPYFYFHAMFSGAEARLMQEGIAVDDSIQSALARAADGFRGLSSTGAGPFDDMEARCYYCLAKWYRLNGNRAGFGDFEVSRGDAKYPESAKQRKEDHDLARTCTVEVTASPLAPSVLPLRSGKR